MAVKTFVIDTNVLIDDPSAIFKFDDNNVVIPHCVLEELDKFKVENSERGAAARAMAKILEALCRSSKDACLADGISLGEGKGKVYVKYTPHSPEFRYELSKADNQILALAAETAKPYNSSEKYIIVTNDHYLRIKANTVGVPVEEYKNTNVLFKRNLKKPYTGRVDVFASQDTISAFKQSGEIQLKNFKTELFCADGTPFSDTVYPNEFFAIFPVDKKNGSAVLGRYDAKQKKIVPLRYANTDMHGVKPRNIGQFFVKEALLSPPDIAPLVIIKGMAGTGKTRFALAAGLQAYSASSGGKGAKKKQQSGYNKILICRPNVTMDEDLGYLPGSEKDKISPYMRAIKDNIFVIRNGTGTMSPREYKTAEDEVEMMFEDDFITAEALGFQRGRTLNNYWFLIDEVQNATQRQVKSVVTRVGKGTKIILLGDPQQIDNVHLSANNNGLVYASESMKESELCWQVSLLESECERSPLAQDAAVRM